MGPMTFKITLQTMAIIMDVWNIIIQTDVEPLCRKILCVHFTTIFSKSYGNLFVKLWPLFLSHWLFVKISLAHLLKLYESVSLLVHLGSGKNGKNKMHELYCVWLSCKGVWGQCSLVVKANKARSQDQSETYDYLTKSGLIQELGSEDLAKDLMERHEQAEKRLPTNQKGQFIKKHLANNWIITFLILASKPISKFHSSVACWNGFAS